jgi:hypothetical protein
MPNIIFAINGVTLKQGPGPLSIASPPGDYDIGGGKKIKIVGVDANHPPVITADDASDKLVLQNAVITTPTAPVDNVKFSFSMQFASLVTGAVTYSIGGSGNFFKANPVAGEPKDWIAARGTVEGTVLGTGNPDHLPSPPTTPPTCGERLTRCADHQAVNWVFNLTAPNGGFTVSHDFGGASGNPALQGGANDMKAEFWIHLEKATNRLTISAAPGIRVKFGPPQDGGETDEVGDGR